MKIIFHYILIISINVYGLISHSANAWDSSDHEYQMRRAEEESPRREEELRRIQQEMDEQMRLEELKRQEQYEKEHPFASDSIDNQSKVIILPNEKETSNRHDAEWQKEYEENFQFDPEVDYNRRIDDETREMFEKERRKRQD